MENKENNRKGKKHRKSDKKVETIERCINNRVKILEWTGTKKNIVKKRQVNINQEWKMGEKNMKHAKTHSRGWLWGKNYRCRETITTNYGWYGTPGKKKDYTHGIS